MKRKLFVLDLTSDQSEIVVFDLRSVKRQRWSSFSPLSAQLSCQPITYFGLFMKYLHSFATILAMNHFVHHEISQLFVIILVQNTELSRLNHGKYSVGYHDLSVCCWRALARQHTILVIRGKIQNFVGCQTRSLRSRALSGIVETTIMRKSHG